jgi:hypothetical protein
MDLVNALSSGLNKKLMSNSFDEGIIELIVLFFKESSFEDILSVYDFLEKFLDKKISHQKLVSVLTFGQLI